MEENNRPGCSLLAIQDSPYFPPYAFVLCSLRFMPKRILIVEDEVSVRTALRTFLEHNSLEVCGEAGNGSEAIEKASALRPDVILLDLSMPIMNGIEAASVLRNRAPGVPIVIYTMFGDVLGSSLAAALGTAAIVSKSDGLPKLLARIKALVDSPRPVQLPAN
jgi:two-component system, chemotaxis family, chemotaxis protein CheY